MGRSKRMRFFRLDVGKRPRRQEGRRIGPSRRVPVPLSARQNGREQRQEQQGAEEQQQDKMPHGSGGSAQQQQGNACRQAQQATLERRFYQKLPGVVYRGWYHASVSSCRACAISCESRSHSSGVSRASAP